MDQFISLVVSHKWLAVASVVIGLVIRLLKDDTKLPTLPKRWRAPLALLLGVVAGVVDKIAADGLWRDAIFAGLVYGALPIFAHLLGVEWIAGGKEPPLPKAVLENPQAPSKVGVPIKITGACLTFLTLATGCGGFWTQARQDAATKAGADFAACVARKIEAGESDEVKIALACGLADVPNEIAVITAKTMVAQRKQSLGAAPCSGKVTP